MEKHAKPLKGETPEQTQSRFKNYQDSMFTILDRERKERQKELVREEQRIFEKKHVNLAQKVISKVERHWSESSQNGQNNLAATNTGDYYEEMNAVRRIMAGHKDEIIDFLYEASSLDGEYYFVTIKDPYFLARKIKTEIHKSENLLTQRGPDYNLKLDEEDSLRIVQASWNEQTQDNAAAHFIAVNTDSPVKDLEEALGLHVISDFITNTATAPLQNPEKRLEELKLLVAKVQTTLNIWNENNEKLPRVAHYFFVVVETIYSACLFPEDSKSILVAESIPSDIRGRALLVGDLLFWLPVHLGDLRTEDHAPRNCLIELSRQLFAIVINGWTKNVSEVSEEEVQMLIRFQLASLRLELSAPKAGPLDDWTASTSSEDLVTQFDQNLREVHQKKNWREKSLVRLPPWKGFQNSMNRNNDI
uniref:Ras-GEF domain-containing protein n=1 Tax=Caenorhabditis tropicalis TaxID=1561998 RepID=A0A1I7TI26_9PELO